MANTLNLGTDGNWGTKEGSVLGYNSENGNFKPLPFNFTRATSATRVNKEGLIDVVGNNEPRIDFKDDSKGALLLEPSRTNILPYSNKFINTGWQYYRGTIIANATISPDGTLNASRYQEDSQTGGHLFRRQSLSITNGLSYTGSIFVKKGELSVVRLASNSTSRWDAGAEFNLENGTVTSGTGVIEDYGNGWYRCSISGNAVETTTVAGFEIYTSVGAGRDGQGLFMYGAMFEQGSYATSYIPTSGSAVTRVADVCNNGGNEQVINSTEGVLYVETSALSNDLSERRFGLSDGTSSNVIRVGYTGISNRIIAVIYNGSNQAIMTYTPSDITQNSKIAVKYKENDFALWVDGVERSTDTNGTVFAANTLNSLDFNIGGGSHFYSKTKDVRVYNTALTDQELAELTS